MKTGIGKTFDKIIALKTGFKNAIYLDSLPLFGHPVMY